MVSVAKSTPFAIRSTLVTPTLSLALTLTGTTPLTEPPVGDETVAVGGWVSPALTCVAAATAAPALTRP